jgi:hypothetical protein
MTITTEIEIERGDETHVVHVEGWVVKNYGRLFVEIVDADLFLTEAESEEACERLKEKAHDVVIPDDGMQDYNAWKRS